MGSEFFLESVGEEAKHVKLENNSKTILGRGDLLNIQDKRCSRQQLVFFYFLTVTTKQELEIKNGQATLKAIGVNPCCIEKKSSKKKEIMVKDNNYKLEDGDIFTVLLEQFPFRFRISSNEDKRKQETEDVKAIPSKKRKIEIEEEDGDISTDELKNKNLPICPYGSKCYRKNPNHFKEYSHSSDSSTSQVSSSSAPSSKEPKKNLNLQLESDLLDKLEPILDSKQPEKKKETISLSTLNSLSPKPPSSPSKLDFNNSSSLPKKAEEIKNVPSSISNTSSSLPKKTEEIKNIPSTVSSTSKPGKNSVDISNIKTIIQSRFPDAEKSRKIKRLGFPPLALSGCIESFGGSMPKVDMKKVKICAESTCKSIAKFLLSHQSDVNIELVLVLNCSSLFLTSSLSNEYLKEISIIEETYNQYKSIYCRDQRFIIRSSKSIEDEISLVNMQSHGIPCPFIVNETNWRLKCSSSNESKQIYKFCEIKDSKGNIIPFLDQETKSLYPFPAIVGNCYPVPLNPLCDLYKKEGVVCVLQSLPPNLNANKADFVEEEVKAMQLLEKAVEQMLDHFYSLP